MLMFMRIAEVPAVDVRMPLTAQRRRLLTVLTSLSDTQWAAPTAAPDWLVKDIALHLLDVDLSWLARYRDDDQAGTIPATSGHAEFVSAIEANNQRWVDGTRVLSPRLITDLLRWSGEQLDAYLGTVDLTAPESVYWAGAAPLWFDLARSSPNGGCTTGKSRRRSSPETTSYPTSTCLSCCARSSGASRTSTRPRRRQEPPSHWRSRASACGTYQNGSQLVPRRRADSAPAASLRMSDEAAWRLLTGARYDQREVRLSGDPALAGPLLKVRGIIV